MADHAALDALTAPNPTERQWIIRAAAELIIRDHMTRWAMDRQIIAKTAAILASSQLATDAPVYLAGLTLYAWNRLAVDILICAQWAQENKWSF